MSELCCCGCDCDEGRHKLKGGLQVDDRVGRGRDVM